MAPSHPFTRIPTSDEEIQAHEHVSHGDIVDGLLSKVGFGTFHRRLLIMCGFGWLADNMWLQAVAIVLPRVQEHFDISDQWIGTVSSSLFTGMMLGAVFWGPYSDKYGRKIPFTMTLSITTVFGLLSGFAFSFWSLCLLLFFLGIGVGGNMPTDGALYLEFLPKKYHYLLTFMSVFFSFGAVIASILGYIILPYTSCPEPTAEDPHPTCDLSVQNRGWRIMLISTAVITFCMFLVRSLWLKLPETPKYLMTHDRRKETLIVLQDIARVNGQHVEITSMDIPSEDRNEHIAFDTVESESAADVSSLKALLSPYWRKTMILTWCIWIFTSVAYTMFNVFLPKYLETLGFEGEAPPSRKDVYWDYMVYSIAGVPGSVIASYMIETRLGRKGTMAGSAFGSSVGLLLFSIISSRITMLLSSSAVSFLATLLYAVIYGYTPEVFDTTLRGTAVGTASGLSRVAGIITPIACGFLFSVSPGLPLYVAIAGFAVVGVCVVLLPYETRGRKQLKAKISRTASSSRSTMPSPSH
ncbi:major facilitator superfamily domain-containing protein [Dichotomocladium elegans]|nr:major facilitator superfamily domain-containing protein [Dichotomocladium elegans]